MGDSGVATERLTRDEYYMSLAFAAAARANCTGRRVGAVLVKDDRVIATGYNGTPTGMPNCLDGGCRRCADREQFASGTAYDLCICVHAEANAVLAAGRFGASTDRAVIYSTDQPCFACSKELIQAGVSEVVFARLWAPDERVAADYALLQDRIHARHLDLTVSITINR
jgi:dCMP deaminase